MRSWLLSCSLIGAAVPCAAQALPAEFDHHRIRLVAHAKDGTALTFMTDSGGGFNAISPAVAERLKLAPAGTAQGDGETYRLVEFPAVATRAGIPAPLPDAWLHGKLVITPIPMAATDGFLGSRWFAGRAWRIDYVRHEMALVRRWQPAARDHAIPMRFQVDDDGRRIQNMPRVTIAVDGQPLDVLLDTGATFVVTGESAPRFAVAPGAQVGGGFIVKSIFDDWHAKHPDWPVIAHGDGRGDNALPMIEVPRVSIAGHTVGPVWFSQRPDASFSDMMSAMTDKPVVGAFGGSGLQYFHVLLDYPKSTAWFGID